MENRNTIYLYSDEIDLKSYIKTILSHWGWIVSASLIAGIAAFFYVSIQDESYVSRTLISISAPSLNVEFEPSIRTTDDSTNNLQNNDLPALALSDKVIVDLFSQVSARLPDVIQNHDQLKGHLTATTESKSEIIELSGAFNDPELSSFVVNAWGKLFVETANLFFEGPKEESQQFLKEQLVSARIDQENINQELVEFQSQNTISFVQTQLDSDKSLQQSYINRRNSLEILLYDIQGIKKQIEQNPTDSNVLSDLTLYTLQNRAFGTAGNVRIDISSFETLSTSDLDSRIILFTTLESTIQSQKVEIEGLIAGLEPLILFRQQQIQELTNQAAELESRRALIQNSYDSLALKVAESEIEQNDTSGRAQIASNAIVPVEPEPRNRVANSALSAIVIAMLAIGIILIRTWWLDEEPVLQNSDVSSTDHDLSGYSNGNGAQVQPVHENGGNGNGAYTIKEDEFPAND